MQAGYRVYLGDGAVRNPLAVAAVLAVAGDGVPFERGAPVLDRRGEIGEDLVVVLLERRNDLENEGALLRPALAERLDHAVGVDPAHLVLLRRERPVVIPVGIGLLQLDDWRLATEPTEPGVRVAIVTRCPSDAHVADVEAQTDRDVALVAVRQQVGDQRPRRRARGRTR